jgi:hypothetical protein
MFPTIDGHFWIVRHGRIIDTDFKEYGWIKKVNGCRGEMIYKEADENTQKIMIKLFMKCLENVGLTMETFKQMSVKHKREPRFNSCFQNCLLAYREGDELKFGSMGWKKKNKKDGIWWEYGGEDLEGVRAFLK